MKRNWPFGHSAGTSIVLAALQVACLGGTLPGGTSVETAAFRNVWETEPAVTHTYDVSKAIKRIAAIDPKEKSQAGQSLYWTAVFIIKGSTGRSRELAYDRQWEKKHLTLDGLRLTVVAPAKVQDELAKIIRAWEQSGLAQIAVGAMLIFDLGNPPSELFLVKADRMVVVNDQLAYKLINSAPSMIYYPRVTTFNGQQFTFGYTSPTMPARGADDFVLTALNLTWRAVENGDLTKVRVEGSLEVSMTGPATSMSPSKEPTESIKRPSTGADADVEGRRNDGHHKLSFKADLPDVDAMLPMRVPTPDGKRCFYLVVTTRRVLPPHALAATTRAKKK